MSNVLTQDEIDALLAASSVSDEDEPAAAPVSAPAAAAFEATTPPPAGAAAPAKIAKPASRKRVSLYDFRRPNKFSKDHMRHIQMLHDNFARIYKPTLSFQTRSNTHLRLIYIEQHTYDEFIDLANNQTIYGILSFLKGRIILGIDIPIILVIIERLLGGEGNSNLTRKELTDIEMSLFHRLMERIIASLTESWGTILSSTPRVEATETNPQIIQIVSPNEIVLKLVIEIAIGEDYTGHITLCYPYVTLAPIIDSLGSHQWITSDLSSQYTKEDEAFIQRRIEKTKVPLIFELGKSTLSTNEVLNLQIGDVIKLEKKVADKLDVIVGGKTKFKATSGILGNHIAAKIEDVIYPDKDDSYIDRILGNEETIIQELT